MENKVELWENANLWQVTILQGWIYSINANQILITEHNAVKNSQYFPWNNNTPGRVIESIKSWNTEAIPPIVALKNPFLSIEKTIEAYELFKKHFKRAGWRTFDNEREILISILESNKLLCYNWNRRLEQFQKAWISIKTNVVTTQEEYTSIPEEEKRVPESLKDEKPNYYQQDQSFILSYLMLLDDVVYIESEKKHNEEMLRTLDKLKAKRQEDRNKKKAEELATKIRNWEL